MTRLDKRVAEVTGLSRARIKDLIAQGRVSVDGRVQTKASLKVRVDSAVVVDMPELRASALEPQDLGLELLFEDEHLVVVVKPHGMVTHPSKGHPDRTLVNGLLFAVDGLSGIGGEERPGIVHRLDKGTSGVMVAAKSDAAHQGLKDQFQVHTVERRYRCLVLGVPDLQAGRIENELGRGTRDRFRWTQVGEGRGRVAVTDWTLLKRYDRAAELECRLHTGRTHQVRVHMSENGWPILGDPLYRDRQNPPPWLQQVLKPVDHQLLHAAVLGFEHPVTGQALRFTVDPPADYLAVLAALEAGPPE